jgi:hypothetical protein
LVFFWNAHSLINNLKLESDIVVYLLRDLDLLLHLLVLDVDLDPDFATDHGELEGITQKVENYL